MAGRLALSSALRKPHPGVTLRRQGCHAAWMGVLAGVWSVGPVAARASQRFAE